MAEYESLFVFFLSYFYISTDSRRTKQLFCASWLCLLSVRIYYWYGLLNYVNSHRFIVRYKVKFPFSAKIGGRVFAVIMPQIMPKIPSRP